MLGKIRLSEDSSQKFARPSASVRALSLADNTGAMLTPEEKKAQLVPALKQSLTSPNQAIRANAELFLNRINPEEQPHRVR